MMKATTRTARRAMTRKTITGASHFAVCPAAAGFSPLAPPPLRTRRAGIKRLRD